MADKKDKVIDEQAEEVKNNSVKTEESQVQNNSGVEFEDEEVSAVINAEYWDFKANPEFIGRYQSDKWAEVWDKEEGKKVDRIIGYEMVTPDGEVYLVTNAYSIEDAFNNFDVHTGQPLGKVENGECIKDTKGWAKIVFHGKGKNSKGLEFNRFDVKFLKVKQ